LRLLAIVPETFRRHIVGVGDERETLARGQQGAQQERVGGKMGAAEDGMVRHADHHDAFDGLVRANRTLLLSLLWAALAACVVSSMIYDVGHWFHAW